MLTQEDLQSIATQLESLQQQITDVKLRLENETNRNIQLIAEGHQDLSRKLDEALKVESEEELLQIQIDHIENELQKIEEWLEQ